MSKDLLEHLYEAPLVAAITGLDVVEQRRAIARGLFATSGFIAEPRAGHARRFSLLSVYECGLHAMAKRSGFDASFVRLAMFKRMEDAGLGSWATKPHAVEGESVIYDPVELKYLAAERLPEFSSLRLKPGYWSVKYVMDGGERCAAWVKWGPLQQAYADQEPDAADEVGVMTWPISALVRQIDKAFAKHGIELRGLNPR